MNNPDYNTVYNIVSNTLSMQDTIALAVELLNDFSMCVHYDGYNTRELDDAIQNVINALEKMEASDDV